MSPEKPPDRSGKFESQMIKCPTCDGSGRRTFTDPKSGKTGTSQCSTCKGKGQVPG
jgi:DnaJ-class molecular chaperone